MDEATARAACREAFPEATVRSLSVTGTGNVKRSFDATLAREGRSERVVVQLYPDVARLRAEAALLRAIAGGTDVPVPAVRAVGRVSEAGYLVTDHVAGVDLHRRFSDLAPDDQRSVVRTFGRALGDLHGAFTFEGFGRLVDRGGSLVVADPATDWPTYLRSLVDEGLDRLAPSLADLRDPVREAVAEARSAGRLPAAPPAALYPWDLRPGNALYDGGGVTAFLDWGDPRTAHAEFSLAKVEYLVADWYAGGDRAESLRGAFYDGYREASSVDPAYWVERRRLYRMGAVVLSAMDSQGRVTRPRYPMVPPDEAAALHRDAVESLL
ncbi:phosphotransferase family protein [Halomarina litorea]|uniref:phosphotransferase family protein n=1 Tax=Halomarina litorea TaxID=2961595 RepID=UPI0020C3CFD7|nr:phosphotransferase [Halomarina sp. BCD28]